MARNGQKKTPRRGLHWSRASDERLLEMRFCDLGLQIEGTWLEERIDDAYEELEERGLRRFRPHFWLSTEWFTPDGVPGVAIPFYLAHPRLMELERRKMLDVEGGTQRTCMRILRHELGHAIDNAYRLYRKARWRELFGKASQPYPESYQPRPNSRRFVLHIDYWYAQSHPSEDFAETFAVWLTPNAQWRRRYDGWPALRKLEYVDELMREIADQPPPVRSRARLEPIQSLKATLGEHYLEKRMRYGNEYPDFYDRDLRRLFTASPTDRRKPSAAQFLRKVRPEIRRLVSKWTGVYPYTIDQVIGDMIDRSRELRLRAEFPLGRLEQEAIVLLAVQTMNYVHAGYHRLAL